MFCIYGRSRASAMRFIDKKLLNQNGEISTKLKLTDKQSDKQIILDAYIDEYFKIMPVRKCSHELSTPELAIQLFELMKKERTFSSLKLMRKTPKMSKLGYEVISKTTSKNLMSWIGFLD